MDAEIVTKGEFARLINVSPGRVSQLITEGKLAGPALVGEGRSARISVAHARAQLRDKLDISQRLGNGLNTRLDGPPAVQQAGAPVLPLPPDGATSLEEQIKQEKLAAMRRQARRDEEEDRANAGRYTRTEDVTAGTRRLVGALLDSMEGGLTTMAQAIAGKFELPQRDVLHLMRQEFRGVREDLARRTRAAATALPELIDDPLDDEDEE